MVTLYDKWLFVLRNLSRLMERPAALQERVFASLFRHAEIDKMQPNERRQYEKSLFDYNDINNSNTKHFREGKEEGLREGVEKGILQVAQNMKAAGISIETIATMTGLAIEEIEKL